MILARRTVGLRHRSTSAAEEPVELTRCADDVDTERPHHRSAGGDRLARCTQRAGSNSLDELAIYVAGKGFDSKCRNPGACQARQDAGGPGPPARPNVHVTFRLRSDLAAGRSTSERRDAALDPSPTWPRTKKSNGSQPERRSRRPILVGTFYGMNLDYMPELGWTYGLPPGAVGHGGGRRRPLPGVQATPLLVGTPDLLQRVCAASRWSCERYRIQRADCSSQVGGSPGNGCRSEDRKPSMITAS